MITIEQAAKDALLVQDACNLSGVLHSFSQAMEAINAAMRDAGEGTDWRNNHPIVRLYVDKLASLCGMQGSQAFEHYSTAYHWCVGQQSARTD